MASQTSSSSSSSSMMGAMNLEEVEDYSAEGVLDDVTIQDQLPTVEEAKMMHAAALEEGRMRDGDDVVAAKPTSSKRKYLQLGLLAIILVLLVTLFTTTVIARKNVRKETAVAQQEREKEVGYRDEAIEAEGELKKEDLEVELLEMAVHGAADFENPHSYQSFARKVMMEDAISLRRASRGDMPLRLRQRYAMLCFYHATRMENPHQIDDANAFDSTWKQEDGWANTAEVDECEWYGVTCDPETRLVTRIVLTNNGLKGEVPKEMRLMTDHLLFLDVNFNNGLKGSIPSGLCDATNFESVFSGTEDEYLRIHADCARVDCSCCSNC